MTSLFFFLLLVLAAVLAGAAGQQAVSDASVITRYEKRDPYGQFALQYLTPGGILVRSQGALKRTPDGRQNVLVQQGSYKYTSPEGIPVEVSYIADENGYRVLSGNIPGAR